jgi:hypothetical protein
VKVSGFRQNEPGDGVPVSEPTTAYLSYDHKNLYIVFDCQDEPGKVRGRLSKREDIGEDDQVAVYLDTFHDRRRAYFFAVNPLGIQRDGIFTEGQGIDLSFDTLWHSEGRVTNHGYIVWIAIPFKSLRFSGEPLRSWGIALDRAIVRGNEVAFWPYVTARVQGIAQQFATLEGLEQVSPGHNVQLIPYGLFARARFVDPSDPVNPKFPIQNEFRGGLDSKLVVRDALTFDVALNPDFSQVESDEPQVTINQRFEVLFPEKRPFFIENAGFFKTPTTLLFTRRIQDPQFGARMTGKLGPWALGVFAIDDRAPGTGPLSRNPFSGRRAGIGVVRVEREFGQQSKLGILVSSRDFASTSNRVFSLDGRIKLSPNWVLTGEAIESSTRQLPAKADCLKGDARLSGPAYFLELLQQGRHSTYLARYTDRSPDFCAELGFVRRVDVRQSEQFAGYFWRPEHRRLISFGPSTDALVIWNYAGQLTDWVVDSKFDAALTGQTQLEFRHIQSYELFQNIGFRKHRTAFSFSTQLLSWLSTSAEFSIGTDVNFFPNRGLNPFLGNATSADAGFTFRPAPRIRFDQTYIFTRLGTRNGSTPAGVLPGPAIFNNHILRSKLNYQFTRELSLRAIVDYNAILPNSQLVALGRTKNLTGDLLFTYLINPGTAFYIGYTDHYRNLSLGPGRPEPSSPTTSIGRQFFVKLSYLFRF